VTRWIVGSGRTGTFTFEDGEEDQAKAFARELHRRGCPFSVMIYIIQDFVLEDGSTATFTLRGKEIERELGCPT
jgi:hypothetical protein